MRGAGTETGPGAQERFGALVSQVLGRSSLTSGVNLEPYKPELWRIEALHALLPETLNYKPGLGWCSASAKRLCSLHLRMNPFSYPMQ